MINVKLKQKHIPFFSCEVNIFTDYLNPCDPEVSFLPYIPTCKRDTGDGTVSQPCISLNLIMGTIFSCSVLIKVPSSPLCI